MRDVDWGAMGIKPLWTAPASGRIGRQPEPREKGNRGVAECS